MIEEAARQQATETLCAHVMGETENHYHIRRITAHMCVGFRCE
jgi:hypothetical protein